MTMDEERRVEILLEDFEGRFMRFAEAMSDVPHQLRDIKARQEEHKDRIELNEILIKLHQNDLRNHDTRIEIIEQILAHTV